MSVHQDHGKKLKLSHQKYMVIEEF